MKPMEPASEEKPRTREGADIRPVIIVRVALIFVAGIALALGGVALLFAHFESEYPHRCSEASPQVSANDLPPQPRLQIAPAQDLQQVRAAEDAHLLRYAWVDPSQSVAQIPIERAMSLWVQSPDATNTAPATNASPFGLTELQMRQDKAKEASHAP